MESSTPKTTIFTDWNRIDVLAQHGRRSNFPVHEHTGSGMATSRRHRDPGALSQTPTPPAYFSFHSDLTSEGGQSLFLKLHVQLNNALHTHTHTPHTNVAHARSGLGRMVKKSGPACAVARVIGPAIDWGVGLHIRRRKKWDKSVWVHRTACWKI